MDTPKEEITHKYEIIGYYLKGCSGEEVIDTAATAEEAMQLLGEYRMAYGPDWDLRLQETD